MGCFPCAWRLCICSTICILSFLSIPGFLIVIVNVMDKMNHNEMRTPDPQVDSILITGSSSGIGRHAALSFNSIGFTVFAGVRKYKDGEELKALAQYPDKLLITILDVTNDTHIANAVNFIESHVGEKGLTALANIAGVMPGFPKTGWISKTLEATPMDVYRWVMEVEYFSCIALTKAFLPLLEKAHTRGGRIIYNSDFKFPSIPFSTTIWGPLSAMASVAGGLRRELMDKGTNVAVAVMAPSGVYTKGVNSFLDDALRTDISDVYPSEKDIALMSASELMDTSVSPQATSDALLHAVLSINPRSVYYPGENAYVAYVAGHMIPDEWLDHFFKNVKFEDAAKFDDPAYIKKVREVNSRIYLPESMMKETKQEKCVAEECASG